MELAHEITSWVKGCAARAEGPKGTPLLNLIISYYETGLDRAVALGQMHLLNLPLEGKRTKDLEEFVKKVNYVLHGLKPADRPSPKTMFEWLWHQVKGLPILRRITDKVREPSQRSRKRSFEWIWIQIAEELRERRHGMNYENVVRGLHGSPPHQLALPAPGGEQSSKTPKQKGPKKTATATAAQPAVACQDQGAARHTQPAIVGPVRSAGITTLGIQVQRQRGSHVQTRRARVRGMRPPRVLASSPAKERTRMKARGRKETTRAPRVAP